MHYYSTIKMFTFLSHNTLRIPVVGNQGSNAATVEVDTATLVMWKPGNNEQYQSDAPGASQSD